MIDLRHLRYFVAVAEELHFGRAAARVHIAQPPLSQQIRRLEEELGVELFHRTKRTVRLRPAGHVFLRHVLPLLNDLDRAIELARQANTGKAGSLAIGFVSSAPYSVLPVVLQAYRSAFPAVTLQLEQLSITTQLESLKRDRINLGVVRLPIDDPEIVTEVLLNEPVILALPAGHPLAALECIAPPLLEHEPFVLVAKDRPGFADLALRYCREHGFEPKAAQEATEMHTVIGLVAAGIGLAFVPESMRTLQVPGVVFRKLERAPTSEMALAWKAGCDLPTVAAFVALAKTVVKSRAVDVPQQVP